jgi:hypothetical protein
MRLELEAEDVMSIADTLVAYSMVLEAVPGRRKERDVFTNESLRIRILAAKINHQIAHQLELKMGVPNAGD